MLKPYAQTAVVGGALIACLFNEAGLPEGLLHVTAWRYRARRGPRRRPERGDDRVHRIDRRRPEGERSSRPHPQTVPGRSTRPGETTRISDAMGGDRSTSAGDWLLLGCSAAADVPSRCKRHRHVDFHATCENDTWHTRAALPNTTPRSLLISGIEVRVAEMARRGCRRGWPA